MSFTKRFQTVVSLGSVKVLFGFFKQVLIIPVLIRSLGEEAYGIYAGALGLMYLLTSLNLGPLLYVGNKLNLETLAGPDRSRMIYSNALPGISVVTFTQTSILLLIAYFVSVSKPDVLPISLWIVCVMVFSHWLYQLVFRFKLRRLEAIGRLKTKVQFELLYEILEITALILLAFNCLTVSVFLLNLAFFRLASVLFVSVVSNRCFSNRYPKYNLKPGILEYKKSLPFVVASAAEKAVAEGLPGVLFYVLTPKELAIFNALRSVFNAITTMGLTIVNSLQPDLQKLSLNLKLRNKLLAYSLLIPIALQSLFGGVVVIGLMDILTSIFNLTFGIWTLNYMYLYSLLFIASSIILSCAKGLNLARISLVLIMMRSLSLIVVIFVDLGIGLSLNSFLIVMIVSELILGLGYGLLKMNYFASLSVVNMGLVALFLICAISVTISSLFFYELVGLLIIAILGYFLYKMVSKFWTEFSRIA